MFAGGKRIKFLVASKIATKMQRLWADLCAVASGCAGLAACAKLNRCLQTACAKLNSCLQTAQRLQRCFGGVRSASRACGARQPGLCKSGCKTRAAARRSRFVVSVTQPARASRTPEVLWPGGCEGQHPAGALEPGTAPMFGISSKRGVRKR